MENVVNKKFKVEKIVYYNSSNKWGVLATSAVDSLDGLEVELLNNYGNITYKSKLYEIIKVVF